MPCTTCDSATAAAGSATANSGEPGLPVKVWNYALALARWAEAGGAVRSPAEIASRLAICQACPHYGTHPPRCTLCGCPVSASPDAAKNKLAMATERCPLSPPKWV